MEKLGEIRQYLDWVHEEQERPLHIDLKKGLHPFVTISRQAGAGGHTLAQTLLRQLDKESDPIFHGWQMFDHQLCMKILEDPKIKVSMQSLLTEKYRSQIEDMMYELIGGYSPQSVVIDKVFQTVRTLATFGKAIIVGRAGSCLNRALPHGVHIRLVAPKKCRIQRMQQLYHLSPEEAGKAVEAHDRSRAKLIRDYFQKDIEDPLLYDAVWNTDTVPLDLIASCTIRMIREKVRKNESLRVS